MNPFITIATIAIAAILAGAGAVAVPGWIDSANESKASSDISQLVIAEEAAYTIAGSYEDDLAQLQKGQVNGLTAGATGAKDTGVKAQISEGVKHAIAVSPNGARWAVAAVAESGRLLVRTSDKAKVFKSDAKDIKGSVTASTAGFSGLPAGVTVSVADDGTPSISVAN